MDDLIIKAGNIIRIKRNSNGYSTKELADILGISTGLLNNIENGKTDSFNLTLLKKLCDTLDISIFELTNQSLSKLNIAIDNNFTNNEKINNKLNLVYSRLCDLAFFMKDDIDKIDILINKLILEIEYYETINK